MGGLGRTRVALLVCLMLLALAIVAPQRASADDVEQRIAAFWARIDALQATDNVSSADLGQWALNVIERNPRARLSVGDFRVATAGMQSAIDRAGDAPTAVVVPTTPGDVEQRIAAFWARIDALRASDNVSSSDLGQWALNVIERNPRARLSVGDFRVATAGMQSAIDRAGDAPPASATCHMSANGLPDTACTPGVASTTVTQANVAQTICVVGYTDTVRPSTTYTTPLKIQQMTAYGLTGTTADYEEDHLISLELGGDPTNPRNLWPEPYNILYGARQKDRVENALHDQVCAGQVSLASAQQQIASNWVGVYITLFGARTPSPSATPVATSTATTGTFMVTITTSVYGSVAATTAPGASCNASARLPSGNLSSAQGLQVTKTADASGAASWSYGTSSQTTPGTGTHTVTCTWSGQTLSASASFSVP